MEVKVEKSGNPIPLKRINRFQHKTPKMKPKFDIRCEDIKSFMFDCANDRQVDQYNITMREIAEYVDRTYTYGGDIRWP
jgi:hypothetical protein